MQGCVLIKKGPDYKFRVSKPGKSVDSTDLNDFIIHDKLGTAAPYITGSAQVPAYSNVYIPFDREYLQPALILLKPENVVAYLTQFEARIQGDMASMRIYNHTGTSRYVTYYVYWNSIGG